jgi:hypothetical protein
MNTFFASLLVILSIFTFMVFALGIKMLFDKNHTFKAGCASNNPMLRNEIGECTVCGKVPEGNCEVPASDELPKIN